MLNLGIFLFYSLLSLPAAPKEQAFEPLRVNQYPSAAVVPVADSIDTANLITFARTLKGIPYRYGCSDPEKGFDCSGFVMYVFNHFQMNVPRSSSGFTNFGKEIDLQHTIPGDIILFTGTNSTVRKVGHVGIVTQVSDDALVFIHASSGKIPAVVETVMNPHYKERFLKVIRVLR
jgi:cell wall-associated NlpC family hydrolase